MKLALIASIILETIQELPDGAPAGPIYAALMGVISLEEFERIMSALVTAGVVTKRGHQYFPTKK